MEPENKIKNKNVETYAEDMAKVIEGSEGGLIKKIIHEQEYQEMEKKNLSPQSKKNKFFIFGGILLVCVALGILFLLGFFEQKISTVPVTSQSTPIIFTDQNYFQPTDSFTPDQIAQSVLNEVNSAQLKQGGIEAIELTENKQIIGLKEFINLIKGSLNIANLPYLQDNFLIGAFNEGTKSDLFILLKMRSVADVFDGMKAWEAKMLTDLHGFFGVAISADTNYLFSKNFEDGIIANKNARILRDNNGNVVLMYIYADDSSIIVTGSVAAATEAIARLTTNQIKP